LGLGTASGGEGGKGGTIALSYYLFKCEKDRKERVKPVPLAEEKKRKVRGVNEGGNKHS